jgi:hypothetical protein
VVDTTCAESVIDMSLNIPFDATLVPPAPSTATHRNYFMTVNINTTTRTSSQNVNSQHIFASSLTGLLPTELLNMESRLQSALAAARDHSTRDLLSSVT